MRYGNDQTVGSFWGSVTNALNPVNQLKFAYNVAKNPLNPLKQTQALRNLFGGGGGGAAPPQYMPPGAYPGMPQYGGAPGQGWGGPPQYGAPQAPPPGFPPGYAPQQYPNYAPAQTYDPNAYYGAQQDFGDQPTGWSAAYGGG